MSQNLLRRFAPPLVAATVLALAGFSAPTPNVAGAERWALAEARANEAPKIFHGVGVVTAVDAASGTLTLDHGDIPGLMDAMEMAYKVSPATLSDGLQKGDKVTFGVEGQTYTIVEIRKLANP